MKCNWLFRWIEVKILIRSSLYFLPSRLLLTENHHLRLQLKIYSELVNTCISCDALREQHRKAIKSRHYVQYRRQGGRGISPALRIFLTFKLR